MFFTSNIDVDFIEPEIEDFISFIEDDEQEQTGFLTKQKVLEHFEELGEILNYFIVYPDMFVDLITPKESKFHLFFFQRLILRAFARSIQTYATFSRGTSKSFLADLDRYLHCMFIPRHNTSITAGTKTQAAQIAKQKIVDDLWVKFPLLSNEMQKRRIAGKLQDAYNMGKDYVEFKFKNGSSLTLGNVRGLRRESIICEEIIEQDPTTVNEVYLPLLNKPRSNYFGLINPYEPQSQQIYITTAGYVGTFAYEKLIEILCRSVLEPEKYSVLTGSYQIPLSCGLTSRSQIEDIISSPSFSKESFEREYGSRWSDAPVGAAFSANIIASLRQIKKAERKYSLTDGEKFLSEAFYVASADMAKDGSARTVVEIAKVIPRDCYFIYKYVNMFSIDSSDYMYIANVFKQLVVDYQLKLFIYDANGIGAAIRDWLNKPTINNKNLQLPGYGIINPPPKTDKDVIKYPQSQTIFYEIKSGGERGEHIHWVFFSRISNGSVLFPIKFQEALSLYERNKTFHQLSVAKQTEILQPYKNMDKMEEELKNLDIVNNSDKITSKMTIARRNTSIQKDYFSAAEYLVFGVAEYLEANYYRKKNDRASNRIDAFIFE